MIDEAAVAAAVSVDQTPKEPKPVPPPPPAPVVTEAGPPPSLEQVTKPVAQSVQPATWNNNAPGGDLPLPAIGAAGLLAAFAAATFAMRGRDEVAEEGSAAGSSSASNDVSIPYDAAARLAYDKAGGTGDYPAFKAKYEADAVAEVIAKKKK